MTAVVCHLRIRSLNHSEVTVGLAEGLGLHAPEVSIGVGGRLDALEVCAAGGGGGMAPCARRRIKEDGGSRQRRGVILLPRMGRDAHVRGRERTHD